MATAVAALLTLGAGATGTAEATAAPASPGSTAPTQPPAPDPAAPGPIARALGGAALAPLPTPGCLLPSPSALTGRLKSGRTYRVHLPEDYDPGRAYPVLLAYHGRSQQARDIQRYSGLDRADAVVLYPQGRPVRGPKGTTAWEGTRDLPVDGKDVAFTRDLLAAAGRSLCLDTRRVTAVGASQGGGFAHVLACTSPGTVSAIAAVAGAFYRPQAGGVRTCRSGPMRVLEFHGTADPVIGYDGTQRSLSVPAWLHGWAARNRCVGGPATTSVPPDVTQRSWTRCAGGSEIQHFRVSDGNHGWPNAAAAAVAGGGVRTDTVSATSIILRFAAGRPLDPASTGRPDPKSSRDRSAVGSSRAALRLPLLGGIGGRATGDTETDTAGDTAERSDRTPVPARPGRAAVASPGSSSLPAAPAHPRTAAPRTTS